MEKFIYLIIGIGIGYVCFLLIRGISTLRERRRKKEKYQNVLIIIKGVVSTETHENACHFVLKHTPMLMSFPRYVFAGKQFKKIRHFLKNIGFDYNQEESMELMLYQRFTNRDQMKFCELLIDALKEPA